MNLNDEKEITRRLVQNEERKDTKWHAWRSSYFILGNNDSTKCNETDRQTWQQQKKTQQHISRILKVNPVYTLLLLLKFAVGGDGGGGV